MKPGGSLAIAAWRSVEHNPAYADIISVLEEHVGTAATDALRQPLFDIFLRDDEIEDVLIKSDQTLGKYAGPSGEAIFSTSAHIYTARKT